MKRFSLLILSLAMLFTGVFVSACGKKNEGEITLSQSSVVIYVGETEDNSVTVNAKVEGISVNSLKLYYDNSNIKIKSSNKKLDGSFDLIITAITNLSTNPIEVKVEANKNVKASFFVEVSLPLVSIDVQENLYIPYNFEDVSYNLSSKLIFNPNNTKQTAVFYEFVDVQPDGIEIVDDKLLIKSAEYIYSNEPIKIKVQSAEAGKSAVMKQFEIVVLKNARNLSDEIIFETNFNGSLNEINSTNYELKIENQTLSVFEVFVKIPTNLGVSVELDDKRTSLDAGNILNILDCSIPLSYVEDNYLVHKFIFSTTKQLSGKGNLYFNFFYENFKTDANLNASFVKIKLEEGYEIKDCLNIDVVIPIKDITLKTYCLTNANGNYVIYKNYNANTMQYGTEFAFGADPVNTTQTQLKITKLSPNLEVYRENGVQVLEGETIVINEKIYIKGNDLAPETGYVGNALRVESGTVSKEILLDIMSGATMFGFVDGIGNTMAKASADVAVEQGDESTFYIYAPGALISDIIYDSNIMSFLKDGDWLVGLVKGVEIGKKAYSIATNNGFNISLNLTTIARINDVKIELKEGTTAGVGKLSMEGSLNFALKYGYSVELNYITTDNSEIEKINYSFYDTLGQDIYTEYAVNPYDIADADFQAYSGVIDVQNLARHNIVTAENEGRTIIRIEVVGQKVENGVIVEDIQDVQYVFVEVYKPATHIQASQKVVTLRAQDQVDEVYYNETTYTMPLVAKSGDVDSATYYQLYLDGGIYQVETQEVIVGGITENKTIRQTIFEYRDFFTNNVIIEAILNHESREITITAFHYSDVPVNIVIFAVDFESIDSLKISDSGVDTFSTENIKNAVILNLTIDIEKSEFINDIEVSNLKLKSETNNEKIYEEIYIDTNKLNATGDNFIKINTEVSPLSAFDKRLNYTFIADAGYSNNMVDVSSNDGLVRVPGTVGGTGYIIIKPAFSKNTVKTVKIPVVVADGNSYATAYRITSLNEIKNSNKHYILTEAKTYTLTYTLFNGKVFGGGLYGCLDHNYSEMATIILSDSSLFDIIGENAVVEGLYLSGTSKNRGFVANENNGRIINVEVTTLIKNGVYVPSLLSYAGTEAVGGIVGKNNGTIKNCSFAGSIDALNSAVCNAVVGENNGTVEGCKLYIAKFETSQNAYTVDENTYINGNLNDANGKFSDQTEDKILGGNVISYENVQFDTTNLWIKDSTNSIGEDGLNYAVLLHYSAESGQIAESYNRVSFEDLFTSDTQYIKVIVFEGDSTIASNKIIANPNNLSIDGTGLYTLKVYSQLDYTQQKIFEIYSIYYFEQLSFSYAGKVVEDDAISMKSNSLQQIISSTATFVNGIKLKENNFNVNFTLNYLENETDKQASGANYISGQQVGKHEVNVNWQWEGTTEVVASLQLNVNEKYNNLINARYQKIFKINKALGTTRIDLNKSEVTIEPKDVLTFEVTVVTDNENDIIDASTITITSEYGASCNEVFNEPKIVKDENTGKYLITISMNDQYKGLADYVDLTYLIKVQSRDGSARDVVLYDCYNIVRLTVLPQTITSIQTVLYKTEAMADGVYVNEYEAPTSVIKPTEQALLLIDLFPEYAYFDHIDIIARSSNQTKLYFSPQKHKMEGNTLFANQYVYDKNGNFDEVPNQNGIRLFNYYGNEENGQIAGQYAIVLYSSGKILDETIYYIDINVYDKEGNKLDVSKTLLLYVKMPPAPEVSINGETFVYAEIGDELDAYVKFANNQTLSSFSIDYLETTTHKPSEYGIEVVKHSEKQIDGVNTCYLRINIPQDYSLKTNNNDLVLSVNSKIIDRGQTVSRTSKVYITIIDFKLNENCVTVEDVTDGKLTVSSLQAKELKLNILPDHNPSDAIEMFRNNYFYKGDSGFVVGSQDGFNSAESETRATKGRVLATYLSYKRDNTTYAIAKFDENGVLKILSQDANSYADYIKFILSSDGSLFVQGGDFVGEVPMTLSFNYKMPNGAIFTYSYNFSIVNKLYTTEDLPKEIANANDFRDIDKQESAQDYILSRDIYLYEYEIIGNTSKIKSLDGNNYTIHIMSFKNQTSANVNYALFNTVAESTTIRNLTVNYYYLNTIKVDVNTAVLNFAGFAITNNGIITNCDVATYYNTGDVIPTFKTYGIKVEIPEEYNVNATFAGFVMYNNSAITNSRVGADSKTITSIVYNADGTYKVNSTTLKQEPFTIRGAGNIAGFVYENNSVITSSFVKNISIVNTYNKQETKRTSGFVDTNNGQISLSYVEGVRTTSNVQIEQGGIEGTGILSGFVYINNSTIYDCYSNIMVKSLSGQVGRLGAGFVYLNTEKATISKAYSFSKVLDGTTTQANFAGITIDLQYNNLGTIEHSYYYASNDDYVVSIENLYNTNISFVKNVENSTNFYGFAFNKNQEDAGTWKMDSNGPKLVSANNIATSFRYKVDDKTVGNNSVAYKFLYANGYEYGTSKNPVIIRNAKELNNVLGGGTGSEYTNNFTNAKIYGAYRLANNINLLELVVDENLTSEYKYNLKSTQMILTGENAKLNGKNGSFDGNGLTINHLAISNNKTATDNYGLFKSLESGARVMNLNITLDKGGVVANNTINVGVVAGTVKDSQLININIKTSNQNQANPFIVGSNLVGGVAGRVIGRSYVANINVENINVTASYFDNAIPNISQAIALTNTYSNTLEESSIKKLSIAGGAFGVVAIEVPNEEAGEKHLTDVKEANVLSVNVKGVMEIYGKTVGGVMGFADAFVIGRNLSLTLTKSDKQAKLIAYNCYAGGIVGHSKGNLYQVKVEHEQSWQAEIDKNMYNYYLQDGSTSVDRGNVSLFKLEEDYTPAIIGGIIGVMQGGKITTAYSKVHVINENAKVAGGAIGLIVPQDSNSNNENNKMEVIEVYATGDVLALNESISSGHKYVGGLIGLYTLSSNTASLNISICNALNYYGLDTYNEILGNTDLVVHFNSLLNKNSGTMGEASIKTVGIVEKVQFETVGEAKSTVKAGETSVANKKLTSYYSYLGITSDDGAQIDNLFKQNEWYDNGNWTRDVNEMFPHIIYTQPVNIHEINSVADFDKFARYGNDSNAIFVIMPQEPINCSDYFTSNYRTFSNFRGTLRGLYPGKSGLSGVSNILFKTTNGAKFVDIRFVNCTSALIEQANSSTFTNLLYENCNFEKRSSKLNNGGETEYSVGGIAQFITTSGTSKFDLITFSSCTLYSSLEVNYAGFLYGQGIANGSAKVEISNINAISSTLGRNDIITPTYVKAYANSSIGKLFGSEASNVSVSAVQVSDSVKATIKHPNKLEDGQKLTLDTANIGVICGQADNLIITDFNITKGLGIEVIAEEKDYVNNNEIKLGGIAGRVGTFTINGDNKTISSDISLNVKELTANTEVTTKHAYKNVYVGSLVGEVGSISCNLSKVLLVDNVDNGMHPQINVVLASVNSFIGGMFGQVLSGTISNLTYNGDIIFQEKYSQNGNSGENIYANIGGIVGEVGSATPGDETVTPGDETVEINTTNFAGTIRTASDANKGNIEYYRLGGIVGNVGQSSNLALTNVISVGDILVNNDTKDDDVSENMKADIIYVGGLVGLNNTTDSISISLEEIISLTTIFALKDTEQNLESDALVYAGNTNVKKNVKYASNITLCTSSLLNSTKNGEGVVDVKDSYNYYYGEVINNANYAKLQNLLNEQIGSKINPFEFDFDASLETDNFEIMSYEKSITLTSNGLRKLYVYLTDDKLNNTQVSKQINLTNAFMFSDGKSIITNVTPFNNIDETSAVSGIISKIYSTSNLNSFAGFANENKGVIYTAMAQEVLNDTNGATEIVQLYGYVKVLDAGDFAGGFVAQNSGYIFGSNSNVILETSLSSGGFVGSNIGYIEYCYTNGLIKGSTTNTDLFVAQNTGSIDKNTCYSLIVEMASSNKLTNNGSVKCNSYASETSVDGSEDLYNVSIDSNNIDSNKYYACNENYNYNYATISANEFKNIEYTKRDTRLTSDYKDDKNLIFENGDEREEINKIANYKKYEGGEDCYYQVPNIEVLKSGALTVEEGKTKNYVLIRDLNFASFGENEVSNLEVKNVTLDGFNNTLHNISLSENNFFGSVEKDSTITNLTFNTVSLRNSTGLINTNNGTLMNIELVGTVKETISTSEAKPFGMLVSVNAGTITNGIISATLHSDSSINPSSDFTFGGLAGTNSRKIQYSKINTGLHINLNQTTFTGTVYFGGLVGTNSGTITSSGLDEEVSITVVTGGVAYVGGITAKHSGGEISKCYTSMNNTIKVGDEVSQEQAYAGGIVAEVVTQATNTPSIKDCYNIAHVVAQAKWVNPKVSRDVVLENSVASENCIYMFQYLESKAYAGGIWAKETSNQSESTATIEETTTKQTYTSLINNGVIEGGYKAWKPIGKIYGNKEAADYSKAKAINHGVGTGLTIAGGAMGFAAASWIISMLGASASAGPWGLAAAAVVAIVMIGLNSWFNSNLKKLQAYVPLNILRFAGNSDIGSTEDEYARSDGEPIKFTTGFFQSTTIQNHGKDDDLFNANILNDLISSKDQQNDQQTTKTLRETFAMRSPIGKDGNFMGISEVNIDTELLDSYYFADDLTGEEVYHEWDTTLQARGDASNLYNSSVTLNKDVEVFFDGISPTLKVTDKDEKTQDNCTLSIHSTTGSILGLDETASVIKTQYPKKDSGSYGETKYCVNLNENNINSQYRYTLPEAQNYVYKPSDKVTNNEGWQNGKLVVSSPLFFNPDKTSEPGKVIFNITNNKYWENVSYTINYQEKETGELMFETTSNIEIRVNLGNTGQQFISVGSYGLNSFDGIIDVTGDVVFQNLVVRTDEASANYGFIKQSSGGKFYNVNFVGDVDVIGNNLSDYTANGKSLGLFIGNANNVYIGPKEGEEELFRTKFDWNIISQYKEVQTFGGIIGTLSGTSNTIKNVDLSVAIHKFTETNIEENTPTYSYGGIVGSIVDGASLELTDSASTIDELTFNSHINSVGGIIGTNAGNLKLTNVTSNVNLQVASPKDTFVGGIIGWAQTGSTTFEGEINVNTDKVRHISSDVLKSSSTPYAGGLIGHITHINIDTSYPLTLSNKTVLGKTNTITTYQLAFIMAGCNSYVDSETNFVIPNKASAGYVYGNQDNSIKYGGKSIKTFNTLTKTLSFKNSENAAKFETLGETTALTSDFYNADEATGKLFSSTLNVYEECSHPAYNDGLTTNYQHHVQTRNYKTYTEGTSVINEFELVYTSNVTTVMIPNVLDNTTGKILGSLRVDIKLNNYQDIYTVRVVYTVNENKQDEVLVEIVQQKELKEVEGKPDSTNDSVVYTATIKTGSTNQTVIDRKDFINSHKFTHVDSNKVVFSKKINLSSLKDSNSSVSVPLTYKTLGINLDTALDLCAWENMAIGQNTTTESEDKTVYLAMSSIKNKGFNLNVTKYGDVSLTQNVEIEATTDEMQMGGDYKSSTKLTDENGTFVGDESKIQKLKFKQFTNGEIMAGDSVSYKSISDYSFSCKFTSAEESSVEEKVIDNDYINSIKDSKGNLPSGITEAMLTSITGYYYTKTDVPTESYTLFTVTNNYEQKLRKDFGTPQTEFNFQNKIEHEIPEGYTATVTIEDNKATATVKNASGNNINCTQYSGAVGLTINGNKVVQINTYVLNDVKVVQIVTAQYGDDNALKCYVMNEFIYKNGQLQYSVSFESSESSINTLYRYENGLIFNYKHNAIDKLNINFTPTESGIIPGLTWMGVKVVASKIDETYKFDCVSSTYQLTIDDLNWPTGK